MTADKNFRKHHRHGLLAGQTSFRVPGAEGVFPGGRHPPVPHRWPATAGQRPGARPRAVRSPLPAARCSALPPWSRGFPKRRLPSQSTAGARSVPGSPRLPAAGRRGRAAVPRPPGETAGTRGRGQEGGGAPVCRPARHRAKQRAARPRRGEETGHILGIAGKGGLRGAPALGGAWRRDTRAHAWCGAAGQGEGCRHCRSSASNSSSPLRSPGLRGGPRPSWGHPRPHRCPPGEPAGKSAPYLEEGTDLILLQVGLDPGLLVRRHEELRGRGLELVSPGGGCSPSGCLRLTPPPHKGCYSGRGRRRCRSPRDRANSGNWGQGREPGASRPLSRARGWLPSGSSGQALPGVEHGAGRRGAAKAAPSPRRSALRASVSPSLCFCAKAAPW